jgi:hypothetical protein
MSVALDLCKSLCRALLALMLAFAVVSPALAEIGCNDDRIVEMSGAIGVTALSDDSSEHDRQAGKATHCSFSHCSQAVPASPPGCAKASAPEASLYLPLFADRLTAAPRDGPERPPRA